MNFSLVRLATISVAICASDTDTGADSCALAVEFSLFQKYRYARRLSCVSSAYGVRGSDGSPPGRETGSTSVL
eukprot:7381779-Prymnesium_polylepis.3